MELAGLKVRMAGHSNSVQKYLATPIFVKIMPTSLPRTRQTAQDVNGTRLSHRTNRFIVSDQGSLVEGRVVKLAVWPSTTSWYKIFSPGRGGGVICPP